MTHKIYKSSKKKRAYQREWVRRKKAGLPTRTTPIPTPESKRLKKHARVERYRQNRKKILEEAFGYKCFFCPQTKVRIIHRKDGKPHKKFSSLNLRQMKAEIAQNKDKYARLCGICHQGFHFCMKHLNMTWDDIIVRKKMHM